MDFLAWGLLTISNRFARLFMLLLCLFVSQPSSLHAQDIRPTLEYQIKASLIFNIIKYIEWPREELEPLTDPFRVCSIGRDKFGAALKAIESELLRGKHISVAHYLDSGGNEFEHCQVIFIGRDLTAETTKLLAQVRSKSILTIGEAPDFLDKGGIVNFVLKSNKITFDINKAPAYKARLTMSEELLRIARTVQE